MKKLCCFFICFIMLSAGMNILASEGYKGYNYNSWGVSEPAPNIYKTKRTVTASDLGISEFEAPSDMAMHDGYLYILDTGNGRIVVLDGEYKLNRIIDSFRDAEGNEITLNTPGGLFVTYDGKLLIADTENGRVLCSDTEGNVSMIITRPENEIFPSDIEFKPVRVLSDRQENIYVLCNGFYYGAVMFDANNKFIGFYGSNKVEITLSQLSDKFWRKLMTDTQKDYLSNYVPIEYTSFDIDEEDFIYTCSKSDNSINEIKKLNSLGSDILEAGTSYDPLNKNDYGEREKIWYNGKYTDTVFTDIDASESGLINALDFTYGRVLQYDGDSNLLGSFGGLSAQNGMFSMPVAVETNGDDVLVLDSEKRSVTVFTPTEYGALMHEAIHMFNDGYYEEALGKWQLLLRQNGNCELAYRGIGRAYLQQEKYTEALKYLKLGQDRAAYSTAFGYYRTATVRKYFPLIGSIVVILLLLFVFRKRISLLLSRIFPPKEKKKKSFVNPFRVIFHPIDGMEEIRNSNGLHQLVVSAIILIIWFVASVIERQGTGFIFNLNPPEELNLLLMAGKTFGLFILFAGCSWAVGTFNDGEAGIVKIINVTAAAIFPYVLAILGKTLLSNLVVYEEYALVTAAMSVVLCYSVVLVVMGIMTAHQYTLGKTVVSLILTVIAIVIVLFVLVLVFSLVQQFCIFIMTLYNEIMFRI